MTPAEFKAAFPAFVNVPSTEIQRHIDASVPWFDVARWGGFYSAGLGYFVAHAIEQERLDTLAAASGGGGAVPAVHKRVGSVAVTYSEKVAAMLLDDPFLSTRYGQRYVALRKQVGMGALAV